jgi:hypothetical protein
MTFGSRSTARRGRRLCPSKTILGGVINDPPTNVQVASPSGLLLNALSKIRLTITDAVRDDYGR